MLRNSRLRVFAICLTCLAMPATGIAVAENDQSQISQPTSDQQQAQPSQPSDLQLTPPTSDSQSGSDQPTQNPNVREWPSPQRNGESISGGSSSQRSSGDWRSSQSVRNSQRGASLGVNIRGSNEGVVITRVHSDTPAQQMGLRQGDRITSVNGEPAGSVDEFIATIRNMNPGDEVELGIAGADGERTIRGPLEAYGQALARNPEPSAGDEYRNYQGIMNGGQPSSDQISRDAQRSAESRENLQTSYEDRGPASHQRSGDVEARLSRVEQQLDRIAQDIEELRNTIGTPRLSSERQGGVGDTGSTVGSELRTRTDSRPRANPPQPNGALIKKNDRWNTENRFEQGALPAARERAAQEAARRRAEQTGARLQQQERERGSDSQPSAPSTDKSQQTPGQPPTGQPPSDPSK